MSENSSESSPAGVYERIPVSGTYADIPGLIHDTLNNPGQEVIGADGKVFVDKPVTRAQGFFQKVLDRFRSHP